MVAIYCCIESYSDFFTILASSVFYDAIVDLSEFIYDLVVSISAAVFLTSAVSIAALICVLTYTTLKSFANKLGALGI
nr:MAG TPA: hypothetical protein [Caudoviricetes sp.]